MSQLETALATIDKAKLLLEKADNITEVMKIRDRAVAIHAYAVASGSDEAAKIAMHVKLRSERKAGEFLIEMKHNGDLKHGGQNEKARSQVENSLSLQKLGIDKNESNRWQRIARLPKQRFESLMSDEKWKVTQSKLLSEATSIVWAEQKKEKIKARVPIPQGQFSIIYADPPWQYDVKTTHGKVVDQYETMSDEKIMNMKIPSSKDAMLFLWATSPKLKEALQVMERWGFQYKSHIIWVKNTYGVGYYVRGKHELLLIGRKGEIYAPESKNIPPSVIQAKNEGHSIKPEIFYKIIEKMYPRKDKHSYLELFARGKGRMGWKQWGDQLDTTT